MKCAVAHGSVPLLLFRAVLVPFFQVVHHQLQQASIYLFRPERSHALIHHQFRCDLADLNVHIPASYAPTVSTRPS